MKTIYALAFAAAACVSVPAHAVEVCDTNCVGPLCNKNCVSDNRGTEGRAVIEEREKKPGVVIEKERRPGVVIEEERSRRREPGVDVEIRR
jgi:hypothetical protein